jgi:DNA-binding transcriptional ArsR family regulator
VTELDVALRALAHPSRRTMLRLVWSAELTSGEIARRAGTSPPATSQHLKQLREAGLVVVRVAANQRLYRVDHEHLSTVRAILDAFWASPLDRLKAAAEVRAALESGESTADA